MSMAEMAIHGSGGWSLYCTVLYYMYTAPYRTFYKFDIFDITRYVVQAWYYHKPGNFGIIRAHNWYFGITRSMLQFWFYHKPNNFDIIR